MVVLAGGTAGVAAYRVLAPHGAQPDTVVPATAVSFVRLDLDPSAGQKIAATRFLSSLPDVAKDGDGVDIKQTLWGYAVRAEPDLRSLDYATDVEPWLGDRAGLALLPGGTAERPNVVIALQTTDPAKARAGIEKVATTGGGSTDDLEVTTKDDYALITPKGNGAAVLADLAKGSLAMSDTYTADLAALGDTGIASAWVDGKGASQLASALGGPTARLGATGQVGRAAVALRFDAGYVELAGISRGGPARPTATTPATGVRDLPADTMLALQVSGLGDGVRQAWPQIEAAVPGGTAQLDAVAEQLGVSLPDDLVTLLGTSTTVAVPKQDLHALDSGLPTLGVKVTTTDAARADALVTRLTTTLDVADLVRHEVSGGTLLLATSDDYLASLRPQGTLGTSPLFTRAVADPASATAVAFADLTALEPALTADAPADVQPLLKAVGAVGMSLTQGPDGSASFAVRVVGR